MARVPDDMCLVIRLSVPVPSSPKARLALSNGRTHRPTPPLPRDRLLKIVEPGPNARPCPCGQRGCLEAYASATAVAAIYSERMKYDAEMKRVATPKASVRNGGDSLPAAPSPPIRTRRAIKVRRASTSAVATRILELERKSSGGEAVFAPGNFPPQVASSDKEEGGDAQTVEHGGPSPLAETSYASSESSAEVNGDVGAITAEEVFARARRGDEVAIRVVEATCDYLALACLNICRTLDPAAILLTGGLARAEGLVGKVRQCTMQNLRASSLRRNRHASRNESTALLFFPF